MMTNSSLQFLMKDPLAEIIVRKAKWSPYRIAFITFLFAWILDIAVSGIAGRIFPSPNYRSLLDDYFHYASITLYPVIMGYYIWLYETPQKVVAELEESGVITLNEITVKQAKGILGSAFPSLIALALGLITSGLAFYQDFTALPAWHNANFSLELIRAILLNVPVAYALWFLLFRYIINARMFRVMLADVVLHPLHPDKAGGLRPLGQYALATSYPIILAGTIVAFAEYWQYIKGGFATSYFYHIALVMYVILTPIIFFAPLRSAHDSMKRAKDGLLNDISLQFNRDLSLARSELSGSSKSLKDNIEKIEQLQKLHKLATAFPVWPYDTETIRRFFVTMFSPVVTVGIPIAINIMSQILTK